MLLCRNTSTPEAWYVASEHVDHYGVFYVLSDFSRRKQSDYQPFVFDKYLLIQTSLSVLTLT
jgi:hypothetical protein